MSLIGLRMTREQIEAAGGQWTKFLHDGAAWSGFRFVPREEGDGLGGWEEVLASDFHEAMEAFNAAQSA